MNLCRYFGYPSNVCTTVSEDDRSSEYSSDSDDVLDHQKDKKP